MAVLGTLRLVCFIIASLFALVALALSCRVTFLIGQNSSFLVFSPSFASLGIASGVLTIMTLPIYLVIDVLRRGAFTSMIWIEMLTLTVVWVLWLATASATTESFVLGCSFIDFAPEFCPEVTAIKAFCFLTWITLMVYAFALLVFTFIATHRGHNNVWFQSVKETNFFAPPVPAEPQPQTQPQQPIMAPVPGYPPLGGPMYQMGSPMPQSVPFQGLPMQQVPQPMYPSHPMVPPLSPPGFLPQIAPMPHISPQPMYTNYPMGSPVSQQSVLPQSPSSFVTPYSPYQGHTNQGSFHTASPPQSPYSTLRQ